MTQAVSLHEVEYFLCQVLGVVASPFECLSHEKNVRAVNAPSRILQMPAKYRMTGAIDFRVSSQHGFCERQIVPRKSIVNLFQHALQ